MICARPQASSRYWLRLVVSEGGGVGKSSAKRYEHWELYCQYIRSSVEASSSSLRIGCYVLSAIANSSAL